MIEAGESLEKTYLGIGLVSFGATTSISHLRPRIPSANEPKHLAHMLMQGSRYAIAKSVRYKPY